MGDVEDCYYFITNGFIDHSYDYPDGYRELNIDVLVTKTETRVKTTIEEQKVLQSLLNYLLKRIGI